MDGFTDPREYLKQKLVTSCFSAAVALLLLIISRGVVAQPYGNPFPEGLYRYDIVAATGGISNGLSGAATFFGAPSINNNGLVAFPCTTTVGGTVCTGDGINPQYRAGEPESAGVQYSGIHIDDTGLITATKQNPGPSYVLFQIDSQSNAITNTIATGSPAITFDYFDAVFGDVSANKFGNAVFTGLDRHVFIGTDVCLNTACLATPTGGPVFATKFNELPVTSPIRPQIADTGNVIVRFQDTTPVPPITPKGNQKIEILNYTLTTPIVLTCLPAPPATPTLGLSPGISADGKIAVYAVIGNGGTSTCGDTNADREGIYLAWDNGKGFSPERVIQIAGQRPRATAELGYGDLPAGGGSPPALFLTNFDPNARVAVMHQQLGDPGLRDDSVVVSFVASPNAPSRLLPGSSAPLIFSKSPGLWTVRVDFDRPRGSLDGASSAFNIHVNSPVLVAQIGDTIQAAGAASVVTGISVYEPLAAAATELDGKTVRTQRRGDHWLAFLETAGSKSFVIRATLVDSDGDGLPDHWEQPGLGIDWNRDGIPDLNLSDWGASPTTRDVFIQADWATDMKTGRPAAYTHRPPSSISQRLIDFFTGPAYPGGAPSLSGPRYGVRSDDGQPADIPAGIMVHIDMGSAVDPKRLAVAYSRNGPTDTTQLHGGNDIFMPGTKIAPDIIWLGSPGSDNDPGIVPGLRTLSFQSIKDNVIARDPAREYAFHYAIFADSFWLRQAGLSVTAAPVKDAAGKYSSVKIGTLPSSYDPAKSHDLLVITTSKSAQGERRTLIGLSPTGDVMLDEPWDQSKLPQANDGAVILWGYSGRSEYDYTGIDALGALDYSTKAGNDFIVSMAAWPTQISDGVPVEGSYRGTADDNIRTFEHELGHNLGLRHGGVDDGALDSNGDPTGYGCLCYDSLMNYWWQFDNPKFIDSYSTKDDAIFPDWLNLRMDIFQDLPIIGNSLLKFSNGSNLATAFVQPEITLGQVIQTFGPRDTVLPDVNVLAPATGAALILGRPLTVVVNATDNVAVRTVTVTFDLNGDGLIDPVTEVVTAVQTGPGTYQAMFPNAIAGPSNPRVLEAVAEDTSGNQAVTHVAVSIGTVSDVTVPNVVGLTRVAASAAITGSGLTVGAISTASSATVPSGSVVSQSPLAGASAASGSAVNLTVSTGATPVTVPNVVGFTQSAASSAITGAGLKVGTVSTAASATMPSGSVISQSPPAGASVASGSAVNLTVSTGLAPVTVPNVVGLTQAGATSALTGAGLTLGTVTTASSATVPSGNVISQSPLAGASAPAGSRVDLTVSTGAVAVTVPNVVGLTQAAASSAIVGAGFKVGIVSTASSTTVPSGSVISQSPLGGTSVASGSAVNITVSSGAAPVTVPNVVGLTQAAATSAITGAGLAVGTISTAGSATVPSGSVISQSPLAGASAVAGSAVSLTVSTGAAPVTVPNVVGLTQAAAASAITGVGLKVGTVSTASSATVPSGSVISQTPLAGASAASGSAVNLTVSSGPAAVTVPNVVGQTQAAATSAITGAGLTVATVTTAASATVPSGSVISQSPASGASVSAGSAVSLVVSSGPATITIVLGGTPAITSSAGGWSVTLLLQNTGNVTAQTVQASSATLGGVAASSGAIPSITLAPGATGSVVITFPSSAGAAGAAVALSVSGSYAATLLSGNWTVGARAKLP